MVVLAVLLVRGGKWRDSLRRTRLLLLCALAAAFVSGVMPVVFQALTGHVPPKPWLSDGVALSYVPFTIAALLAIPASARRPGHRARALADGLLAASSLWYLLAAVGVPREGGAGGLAAAVVVAYPAGGLFVVATALTVLARCPSVARRFVAWIVAGLSLVAANDVWLSMDRDTVGPALVYQLGLLVLVGAASAPAVRATRGDDDGGKLTWALGVIPFLPLFVCMALTTHLVFGGRDLPHTQVLPALVVAIALTARQLTASRDKERLIGQLTARERGLQADLRRDHLTGLANRLGMMERLDSVLSDDATGPVAIALIDLNDFKLINDNHGHAVGDLVLQRLAGRLVSEVREQDLVARLGGDEFAVIASGVTHEDRSVLASRLLHALELPVTTATQSFAVTASIGIVVAQRNETAGELLAHADAAMYEAKAGKDGTSTVRQHFDLDRSRVASTLRVQEAIASPNLDEFHVLYQPLVDLATGRIRGIEALLRWNHPVLGAIPPDIFIPQAERAGSIAALGQFVLDTALADLAKLTRLRPDYRLAAGINVSPRQMVGDEFGDRVLSLVEHYGLQPDQVVLEITEHAFEADLGAVSGTVSRLAEAGVSFAVDDFGTGYSSLRYLQRLELEIMKIDRTFIGELSTSAPSRALVSALAAMGSTLGLQLVAEGIETFGQLRLLQQMNCEIGQGYLFSRPIPMDEIEQLVARRHAYPIIETKPDLPAQTTSDTVVTAAS